MSGAASSGSARLWAEVIVTANVGERLAISIGPRTTCYFDLPVQLRWEGAHRLVVMNRDHAEGITGDPYELDVFADDLRHLRVNARWTHRPVDFWWRPESDVEDIDLTPSTKET